ncbi:MAG TPA: succinate dehydrogenase cytochrome b subunit [Acidimicrobiales bacterium]|nr:succinate dehydrogenase cytochrome b subunit [Acidimicrobiales bacterium]
MAVDTTTDTAAAKPPRAAWPVEFYRSQLGKKIVMAVTGIIGFGFILGHLVGNLKLYLGAEHINEYGEWLRDVGEPALPHTALLWIARTVLVGAIVLHVHAAYALTRINHTARPTKYADRDYIAANYASRTMRWGGVIILLFIAWHLADLTWGTANPDFHRGEVYSNIIASFERPAVAALYIVANLALGLHLFHGLWSMFQTLGWSHDRFDPWRRNFALAFAFVVTVGNVSFPIAVLTGAVS